MDGPQSSCIDYDDNDEMTKGVEWTATEVDSRGRMALACLFCGVLPLLEGWPASSFSLASCRTRPGQSLAQITSWAIFGEMQNTSRVVFYRPVLPFLRRHCNYKNESRQQIKHT